MVVVSGREKTRSVDEIGKGKMRSAHGKGKSDSWMGVGNIDRRILHNVSLTLCLKKGVLESSSIPHA